MAGHADFTPFGAHLSVFPNQEGRAFDAHILAAIQALFDDGAKRVAERFVRI